MKKYKKSKSYYYYTKQKLYGLVLIILGVLVSLIDGSITASVLAVPIGLGLIVTRDRVIMDDYYWEMKAKEFDKWREP